MSHHNRPRLPRISRLEQLVNKIADWKTGIIVALRRSDPVTRHNKRLRDLKRERRAELARQEARS